MATTPKNTDTISHIAQTIENTTGLDYNSALTVIQYAALSYRLSDLQFCPPIIIQGETNTGKTTLLSMVAQLAANATIFGGQNSAVVLRDSLKENTTLLIDEADFIDENILISRFSRESSKRNVNRPMQNGAFLPQQLNLFGATLLHRRTPLKDPAIASRCIALTSRAKPLNSLQPYIPGSLSECVGNVASMSIGITAAELSVPVVGRALSSWQPMLVLHKKVFGETDWCNWVDEQITYASELLQSGREDEPRTRIWSAIAANGFTRYEEFNMQTIKTRVLLNDIVKYIRSEGTEFNGWQVGQLAREMGFTVQRSGGHQWIIIHSLDQLKDIVRELNILDSLLNY